MTIIIVKNLTGWSINSTNGRTVSDMLTTTDPIKAKAHVDYLLSKGYQFKPYVAQRWEELQKRADDQETPNNRFTWKYDDIRML